jgi:hypothetical protein
LPRHRTFRAAAACALLIAATGTLAGAATTAVSAPAGGTLFVANTDTARVELYPAEQPKAAPTGSITQGVLSPYNLAVDASGTLYVQNGNNTITEYPRGTTSPSKTLQVTSPSGTGVFVAVGPDGTVYSANRGVDEIYEFADGSTQITGILGLPSPDKPSSVAVSSANNVYIGYSKSTVPGAAGVWVFPGGQSPGHDLGITLTYGGGLGLDPDGNLLAGDAGTQMIAIYKPGASKPFRKISTAPYAPYQFAFDAGGKHLYVVGGKPSAVLVYDYATGAPAWTVQQGLSGVGFSLGVAFDPAAKL